MACAESNIAVDILYSEFLRAGLNAVRIGVFIYISLAMMRKIIFIKTIGLIYTKNT